MLIVAVVYACLAVIAYVQVTVRQVEEEVEDGVTPAVGRDYTDWLYKYIARQREENREDQEVHLAPLRKIREEREEIRARSRWLRNLDNSYGMEEEEDISAGDILGTEQVAVDDSCESVVAIDDACGSMVCNSGSLEPEPGVFDNSCEPAREPVAYVASAFEGRTVEHISEDQNVYALVKTYTRGELWVKLSRIGYVNGKAEVIHGHGEDGAYYKFKHDEEPFEIFRTGGVLKDG